MGLRLYRGWARVVLRSACPCWTFNERTGGGQLSGVLSAAIQARIRFCRGASFTERLKPGSEANHRLDRCQYRRSIGRILKLRCSHNSKRTPRSAPHLHQLCRAPEPHDSHDDSPLHSDDVCFLKEAGQSQGRVCAPLRLLQFLPDTQKPPRDGNDGSGRH